MRSNEEVRTYAGRLRRIIAAVLFLTAWMPGLTVAQQYEQPAERRAADVLPPDLVAGPSHRVQDTVLADGYMYRFTVDSPFSTFDVTGSGALRKLTREIQAIG